MCTCPVTSPARRIRAAAARGRDERLAAETIVSGVEGVELSYMLPKRWENV